MDIFVDIDSFTNSNIVTDIEISLYLDLDTFSNLSIVTAIDNITIGISPNTFNNDNIISFIDSVDFSIAPNTFSNSSIISDINVPPLSTPVPISSISNTNTVTNINGIFIPNVSNVTIVNSNIVTNLGLVTYDIISSIGSIVNNGLVSNIKTTLTENIAALGKISTRKNTSYKQFKDFIYSDFSLDFISHPLTNDIGILYDVDAIKQSINNIINTNKFERPFNDYDVASKVRSFLFDLADGFIDTEIKNEIFSSLMAHEPRIVIENIASKKVDAYSVSVSIFYRIKKTEKIEEFKTLLKRI